MVDVRQSETNRQNAQMVNCELVYGEVQVNKRRSRRFSQGGGALFFLLLLAPFFVGLVRKWPTSNTSQWWAWPLYLALLLFFAVLVWFLSLRPLIRQGLWKIPRTWYESCFGIGILYTFFALFTFVTGYTPSKYSSHPVPRSAGIIFLYWAIVPLIVGSANYIYDRYNTPQRRR
jgi:hypothetical protein